MSKRQRPSVFELAVGLSASVVTLVVAVLLAAGCAGPADVDVEASRVIDAAPAQIPDSVGTQWETTHVDASTVDAFQINYDALHVEGEPDAAVAPDGWN